MWWHEEWRGHHHSRRWTWRQKLRRWHHRRRPRIHRGNHHKWLRHHHLLRHGHHRWPNPFLLLNHPWRWSHPSLSPNHLRLNWCGHYHLLLPILHQKRLKIFYPVLNMLLSPVMLPPTKGTGVLEVDLTVVAVKVGHFSIDGGRR